MSFGEANRLGTPAGALVEAAAHDFHWHGGTDPARDPVRANLDSLSQAAVLSGLLSVLRASEIIGGQRFTYREVWGCVARSLVGELPGLVRSSDAESYVATLAQGDTEEPSFDHMRALARHRWFVSLFGGLEPLPPGAAADPVLRLTALADPLLDASPEWATPVTDAFASSVLEQ